MYSNFISASSNVLESEMLESFGKRENNSYFMSSLIDEIKLIDLKKVKKCKKTHTNLCVFFMKKKERFKPFFLF